MAPDTVVERKAEERRGTLLEAVLNLGQVAGSYPERLEAMIGHQRANPKFTQEIPGQTKEIKQRLAALSQLLFDFSRKPADFTLIHGQVATEIKDDTSVLEHEAVFRKKAEPGGPGLYFRERTAQRQRIYTAILAPGKVDPSGDQTAVPQISVWPSGYEIESSLFLLVGEKSFYFDSHLLVDTMGQQKMELLGKFIETYAKKFLSR